jgi:hypothetical protein
MPKRRLILAILAVGILAALAIIVLSRPREPAYNRHTLTSWVARSILGPDGDGVTVHATEAEVREALVALATNNFPLLLQRLSYDAMKSPFHKYGLALPQFLVRMPPFVSGFNAEGDRDMRAADAQHVFTILGPLGAPAAPQLARISREAAETPARRALLALAHLGDAGLPAILDAAANKNYRLRPYAIQWLALHTNSPVVRSLLTNALADPDLVVRQQAEAALAGKAPF